MAPLAEQQYFDRAQVRSLPFLSVVALAMLFIYYGRNIVRFGFDLPLWHHAIAGIAIAGTVAISLLSWRWKVPEHLAQLCGAILVLLHGAATISNIAAGVNPGVYSSALSVIGVAIAVLTQRAFFITLLIYLSVWMASIASVQSISEWSSTALFVAASVFVSLLIFRRRQTTYRDRLALINRVDELESFLSLCANCRKIRDGNQWLSFEEFMREKEGKEVSHGICPACSEELYGDLYPELKRAKA